MKKTILTIVFALVGIFTTQAQWYIGGSVGAFANKESQSFSISPDVGYSFTDVPISVACAIEYEGNFLKGEGSAHDLIVTPYFRYNICDIGERFSFFMDLFSGIDMLRFNIFNVGLSPGVSFDVTEHWSAEFSIGFLGYEWERIPDDKPLQSFEFGFEAAAPSFGLYYSF